MQDTYDIVIIGAGLVGASLANLLKDSPYRIAVIDAIDFSKLSATPTDIRSIALSHSSHRILSGLNLWEKIAHDAAPIQHVHVSEKGRFGKTRLHAGDYNIDALGHVVSIPTLAKALHQSLQHSKSVDLIYPAKVTDITINESAATLAIEKDGASQTIQTKLVIAADGTRSRIREHFNIECDTKDYQETAIVARLQLAQDHQGTAYERFTKEGVIAMLPLINNACDMIWTCPNDKVQTLLEMTDHDFLQQLQRLFGYRLGRLNNIGKRFSYPLKLIRAKQQTANRFVLLGNAAHTLHPIGAQGFNLALRDAAILAQTLLEQPEQLGSPTRLQSYQVAQEKDQGQTIRFADSLVSIFCNDLPGLGMLRSISLLGLDLCPPLKHRFAKWGMGNKAKSPVCRPE